MRAVRNLRAEYKLDPGQRLPARMASVRRPALLAANRDLLCALARLDAAALDIGPEPFDDAPYIAVTVEDVTVGIARAGLPDQAAERQRLESAVQDLRQRLARSQTLLANDAFRTKAPAEVVHREQDKSQRLMQELEQLTRRLQAAQA